MKQITKNLKCISMRNGIEIWIEADRAKMLQKQLPQLQSHKFIDFDERIINTADLTGIFTPQDMADLTNRKNGQWKCEKGKWHDKATECECHVEEEIKRKQEIEKAYSECNKCEMGSVIKEIDDCDVLVPCECIKDLKRAK